MRATIDALPTTRHPPLESGRRYWFRLRSGRLWCGTLVSSCAKLVVLSGAIELTDLRPKPARAFFAGDVVAVGELAQ